MAYDHEWRIYVYNCYTYLPCMASSVNLLVANYYYMSMQKHVIRTSKIHYERPMAY